MEKWGDLGFEGHHRASRVPRTPYLSYLILRKPISGNKMPQARSLISELPGQVKLVALLS